MRISILILACLFLSLSVSDKLSETEDEERSNECGRAFDTEGHLNDDLSPWTVRLRLQQSFVSASLISKRHVMTSFPALIETELIKGRWREHTWETDRSEVSFKTCMDGVMEVPKGSLKVDFQACNIHYRCPWIPGIPVKSIHFIGSSCIFFYELINDLILIELEKDIPDDLYHFTPICLADSSDVVDNGEDLQIPQASNLNLTRYKRNLG
ncbi:hypothetical protein L3Y34_015714 [Caenorhabditis briggsae]|uniref:Uncharacterized protein n=1 Tax=Caenorhabditis briggsae TaxID=6238 RepID=A0AAE9J048_CAEBR|nr:hypothetical protein L3Y34_015714 [Caenorhabditis briggsae]